MMYMVCCTAHQWQGFATALHDYRHCIRFVPVVSLGRFCCACPACAQPSFYAAADQSALQDFAKPFSMQNLAMLALLLTPLQNFHAPWQDTDHASCIAIWENMQNRWHQNLSSNPLPIQASRSGCPSSLSTWLGASMQPSKEAIYSLASATSTEGPDPPVFRMI